MIAGVLGGPAGETLRAPSAKRKVELFLTEGVEDALDQHHLRRAELAPARRGPGRRRPRAGFTFSPCQLDEFAMRRKPERAQLTDHVGDDRDQGLRPQ